MPMVVVHKLSNQSESLLKLAFCCGPVANIVIREFSGWDGLESDNCVFAVPDEWELAEDVSGPGVYFYKDKVEVPASWSAGGFDKWCAVSNGRFFTSANPRLLRKAAESLGRDVVAVNIDPNLRAGSERIHTDSQHNLFGFRLLYADAVEPTAVPSDWPHFILIKPRVIKTLFPAKIIPDDFSEFMDKCDSNSVATGSFSMGGLAFDLSTESGLLSFLSEAMSQKRNHNRNSSKSALLPAAPRLFGEVAFGKDVNIGRDVVIAGPAVICDGTKIANDAVIYSSIISPGVSVPAGSVIRNRVITDSRQISQLPGETSSAGFLDFQGRGPYRSPFRTWPRLSYARCIKRLIDVLVAATVLMIFMPFLPVIAVIIKLSSKGPVFFKSIRQGLHGKPFVCLKFRTMKVGADRLQEELREFNEADGPQFVIAKDPRLSRVGRFLRETYIDEIPQFFAVLLSRMSVVGPRPSPESENVLCPFWRDARLSVKPGVTGLWQTYRTRKPMRDFQEWIHYDVEYVRNLSLFLDLRICWKTFLKMIRNFVRQFQ